MSAEPLIVAAITRAKPGKAAALRSAQEQLVADTLQEEGCLGYVLHQSLEDENALIVVESWTAHEQWRAHMEGEAMRRFRATGAGDRFAGDDLHRLRRVAG